MSDKKSFREMTIDEKIDDIGERVNEFNLMKLPGQPKGIHMGTMYLINDMERTIKELKSLVDETT